MIVDAARSWIGVPYHHQGRVRAGLDCVGLLVNVGKQCGYFPQDFDFTDYGRIPTGLLDRMLKEHLEPIDRPVPGAVVAIRWWKMSHHVGIIGSDGERLTLIHSHFGHGGVKEHGLGAWHRKRINSVWKYRGSEI